MHSGEIAWFCVVLWSLSTKCALRKKPEKKLFCKTFGSDFFPRLVEESLGRLSQTEDRNRCWSATEMTVRTETASAAASSFDVASITTARTRQ